MVDTRREPGTLNLAVVFYVLGVPEGNADRFSRAYIHKEARSSPMSFERALHRYVDRIYRLALVRELHPRRAAQATIKAYMSLDWSSLASDDRLEERLIAALPPVKRHVMLPRLHRTSPGNLPAAFWKLAADVRLALALRWTRGYDAAAIAEMLGRSPDEMHRVLETALNELARMEPSTLR